MLKKTKQQRHYFEGKNLILFRVKLSLSFPVGKMGLDVHYISSTHQPYNPFKHTVFRYGLLSAAAAAAAAATIAANTII